MSSDNLYLSDKGINDCKESFCTVSGISGVGCVDMDYVYENRELYGKFFTITKMPKHYLHYRLHYHT